MTSRTDHALAHPCHTPDQCTLPEYAATESLPGGNLLRTILAVDR